MTPEGAGRCYLPKVAGPCKGMYEKWYFDQQWRKCMPFRYGGCLGNGNRYDSEVACQESCLHAETEKLDICSQPLEPGPCRGSFQRFYYDSQLGSCHAFNYTGCKGNRNRFMDSGSCEAACSHKAHLAQAKRKCSLPKRPGPCKGAQGN